MNNKKAFFTDKYPLLNNNRKYFASGIVNEFFTDINNASTSGKDIAVSYIEPFTGSYCKEWRSLKEVELYFCEDENQLQDYELANESINIVKNKTIGESIPGEVFGTKEFVIKLKKTKR